MDDKTKIEACIQLYFDSLYESDTGKVRASLHDGGVNQNVHVKTSKTSYFSDLHSKNKLISPITYKRSIRPSTVH